MKMYAWIPIGKNSESLYVMAKTKEDAKTYADNYVKKHPENFDGWNTVFYTLLEADEGDIITNTNY